MAGHVCEIAKTPALAVSECLLLPIGLGGASGGAVLPKYEINNYFNNLWRRGWDSNPRYPHRYSAFRVRCNRPLYHLSVALSPGWLPVGGCWAKRGRDIAAKDRFSKRQVAENSVSLRAAGSIPLGRYLRVARVGTPMSLSRHWAGAAPSVGRSRMLCRCICPGDGVSERR